MSRLVESRPQEHYYVVMDYFLHENNCLFYVLDSFHSCSLLYLASNWFEPPVVIFILPVPRLIVLYYVPPPTTPTLNNTTYLLPWRGIHYYMITLWTVHI
jgi:hypothetical protein